MATGNKVLVKVLAFGSSFALCQAHREVTVKQSPLVSGNLPVTQPQHYPSSHLSFVNGRPPKGLF